MVVKEGWDLLLLLHKQIPTPPKKNEKMKKMERTRTSVANLWEFRGGRKKEEENKTATTAAAAREREEQQQQLQSADCQ
jgi:hypothetical protein